MKELKLRCSCYVLLQAVLAVGIRAQVPPAASDIPSDQQVLAFLSESIDWYRHQAAEEQLGTEPGDLVFLEDNRPVATHILQLSFAVARAHASFAASLQTGNQSASAAIASSSSAELATQREQQELEAIRKKFGTAQGAERETLQAALDVSQRRLDVLQAELASLRELVDFVQITFSRQTDLTSSIEDLARTVPEVANPTAVRSQTQHLDVTSFPKPRESGILGLSSQVARLERKLRTLDDEIRRTDKLRQSSSDVRSPLLAYANKRFPISADNNLPATDLGFLQQQKAELDALIAVAKTLAPAIVASDKQNVLFTAYISRLKTWRAAVEKDNAKTWRSLILRLVCIGVAIGALLLIGTAVRKLTDRHVHAAERRHVLRVAARVAPWMLIVLVVAFSFTSDLTSLATFFGLLTAGIAIALQNVIVSALGYFLLVGKGGIRVGDRVQISGITGYVTDIGWLQFQICENDQKTQQSTGNLVTFPNSLVLSSGGLGKFNHVRPGQLEVARKTASERD